MNFDGPFPTPPSVLLVDDIPSNLLALEAVLEPIGARLVTATSGKEAIARVSEEPFAVALLDVQMPEMDGFETAVRIRKTEHGRELPILFVTAIHRDDIYMKRGYEVGAADYITKPFDINILRARVRAFVDLFQQREHVRAAQVALRTHERDEAMRKLVAFEHIATAALETSDLASFLRRLLDIVMQAVDAAEIAAILLRHEDVLQMTAMAGATDSGIDLSFVQRVGEGLAGTVARTRQPLHMTNHGLDSESAPPLTMDTLDLQERWGTRGLLGVPMLDDGDLLGVAVVGSRLASTFSPAEQRLVQAMAERAARTVAMQRQQNRLRNVLLAAPALIAGLHGPSHEYEFANPAFRAVFGGGLEVAGHAFGALGSHLELLPLLHEAYQTGECVTVPELRTTSDDASPPRYFGASIQPQRASSGRVEGVLVYLVDVTLHVEARQALERHERERIELLERERAARAEAELANRAKDEFLATVSHELRTPSTPFSDGHAPRNRTRLRRRNAHSPSSNVMRASKRGSSRTCSTFRESSVASFISIWITFRSRMPSRPQSKQCALPQKQNS